MKIAVITPVKHLSGIVELLKTKGEVFYLETGTKQQVRQLLLDNDIDTIVCNPNQQTYKIDRELLDGTHVKLINTCSTGTNHIDINYTTLNDITVYSLTQDHELINQLPSTAELAFGLMLSLLRNISSAYTDVKCNNWQYTKFIGQQVNGLNIGIIGYGRLGKLFKQYCDVFGANTFIYDPYVNIPQTSLDDIFKSCDVVSLHVHVTPETKYMINKKLLDLSSNSLYIINTSRGEIVHESDIVNALQSGKLTGYATDVLEHEFDTITDSPILKEAIHNSNIIITPHIGGMTLQGQLKAYAWAINKLK